MFRQLVDEVALRALCSGSPQTLVRVPDLLRLQVVANCERQASKQEAHHRSEMVRRCENVFPHESTLVCRRAISRWQYTLRCHRPPLGLAAGRAFSDAGSTESRPNVSHRNLAILQSSQRAAHLRWLAAAPAKPHGTRRTIVWRARDRVQDLRNGPVPLKRAAQRQPGQK